MDEASREAVACSKSLSSLLGRQIKAGSRECHTHTKPSQHCDHSQTSKALLQPGRIWLSGAGGFLSTGCVPSDKIRLRTGSVESSAGFSSPSIICDVALAK